VVEPGAGQPRKAAHAQERASGGVALARQGGQYVVTVEAFPPGRLADSLVVLRAMAERARVAGQRPLAVSQEAARVGGGQADQLCSTGGPLPPAAEGRNPDR
jgi:hypothetical protein